MIITLHLNEPPPPTFKMDIPPTIGQKLYPLSHLLGYRPSYPTNDHERTRFLPHIRDKPHWKKAENILQTAIATWVGLVLLGEFRVGCGRVDVFDWVGRGLMLGVVVVVVVVRSINFKSSTVSCEGCTHHRWKFRSGSCPAICCACELSSQFARLI